jgi:hypothetical protein
MVALDGGLFSSCESYEMVGWCFQLHFSAALLPAEQLFVHWSALQLPLQRLCDWRIVNAVTFACFSWV